MSVVKELICIEADNTISFGNYELSQKSKKENFEYNGDLYKVKTFNEITKLERNGMFVYESVPGTAVSHFAEDDKELSFEVEGMEDAQITVELEEETEYRIWIDGEEAGTVKTNKGGKLSLSVELENADKASVKIQKA